jgi:hypothetical protein
MSLERRIEQLEAEMEEDDGGLSLAERLREALEEAKERRILELPRPSPRWEHADHPLAQRLRQAMERAEACRQQLAGE